MPSAQQVQIEEPPGTITDQRQADVRLLLHEIHAAKINNLNSLYGRGIVLFSEGEPARGIYILRSGRAAVSISSSEGRVVMLRIAEAGDVVGLNSVLQNVPYDSTVKTLEPCRIHFIARGDLIDLTRRSPVAAQAVLRILSHEVTEITDRIKLLLLPQTVNGRLARLLLDWSKHNGSTTARTTTIDRVFTHEEIAQMICSSRETVTRMLASLSRQQVIQITPDSIVISDRPALEQIARS